MSFVFDAILLKKYGYSNMPTVTFMLMCNLRKNVLKFYISRKINLLNADKNHVKQACYISA